MITQYLALLMFLCFALHQPLPYNRQCNCLHACFYIHSHIQHYFDLAHTAYFQLHFCYIFSPFHYLYPSTHVCQPLFGILYCIAFFTALNGHKLEMHHFRGLKTVAFSCQVADNACIFMYGDNPIFSLSVTSDTNIVKPFFMQGNYFYNFQLIWENFGQKLIEIN